MNSRLALQTMLEKLLESRNVYFQPPASVQMKYPAIVYSLNNLDNIHANNSVYTQNDRYELTYIDKNPDSPMIRTISKLSKCRFDRSYVADNLNHYVFTLYY
jgi:hypothetical protein